MTSDRTDDKPQPTDPSREEIVEIDAGADTEAHSMLNLELARTITDERVREGIRQSRNSALAKEARPRRNGGILERLRRR